MGGNPKREFVIGFMRSAGSNHDKTLIARKDREGTSDIDSFGCGRPFCAAKDRL
jgi:hypothetical protein